MPRVKNRTVAPEFIALELLKSYQPVTPEAINAAIPEINGNYASKYICFLRRLGYEFSTVKDGRKVLSYTLLSTSPVAATVVTTDTVTPASASDTDASPVAAAAPVAADVTMENVPAIVNETASAPVVVVKAKAKTVKAKPVKVKSEPRVSTRESVSNAFSIPTAFSVDGDFDAFDGDIRSLL